MATLTVGLNQQFATISAAVAASHDGDVLQVQAGTYTNDFAEIRTKITLMGVGGMVHMVATGNIPGDKGILVTDTDVTIDHFEFSGAKGASGNDAGIRYQGGALTLTNDYFHDNQNGLLAAASSGTISIDRSEFDHNGAGDGYTHNLYVGDIAKLTISNSYFHDAVVGHEIKSRAEETDITNTRVFDNSGSASYSIDLPNGGRGVITNNTIEQGPNSQNPNIIAYGEEGGLHGNSTLTLSGNTVLNDLGRGTLLWDASNSAATIGSTKVWNLADSQLESGSGVTVTGTTHLTSEPPLDKSHPFSASAPPANHSPVAVDDSATGTINKSISGNVLSNDKDADGDVLHASLKTTASHGSVSLGSNGAFTYTPTAGYVGADSFTYAVSDGQASDIGAVAITVTAAPPTGGDPVLTRPGTQDGSSAASQTLQDPLYHNTFYFDTAKSSGADKISGFDHDDILALTTPLLDSNHDGLVAFKANVLHLGQSGGSGSVTIPGTSALRYLGVSDSGLSIYADAAHRPKNAAEGTLGARHLSGDAGDKSSQVFFYDTALDLNAGQGRIDNFGGRDLLVTTSALKSSSAHVSAGSDGLFGLVGGSGAPGDASTAGEAGRVAVYDGAGHAVTTLEYDGVVTHDDVHYNVYSLVGSSAGLAALSF